ncbi:MAG: PhnD/SsuA/transferrin family substrate-binding protein [Ectothiorhodospiraceae bacterium]|nr:PhnD/SsuA/transferrin family substrate-binding protein [Ectothiorhodospiraceae bacterium]
MVFTVLKRPPYLLLLAGLMNAGYFIEAAYADEFNIALRAYRGADIALKKWQPTADYLNKVIPGHHFSFIPFEINSQLNQAVSRGDFDFVLTNPAAHVEHNLRYGATPLVTLINRRNDGVFTQFGTVIFTLASRNDITSFHDLKGKKFMGADELGFGGWRMAWREMVDKGVDPNVIKLTKVRCIVGWR